MTDKEETREDEGMVAEAPVGPMRNAPWWLVSVGIHVVLMLAATLVAIEKLYAIDPGDVTVVIHSTPAVPLISEIPKTPDAPPGIPIKDHSDVKTNEVLEFWDPTATIGEKPESADDDDHRERKGEGKEFIGYQLGRTKDSMRGTNPGLKGTFDTLGVGAGMGGSGRHGGPFGGRFNKRPPGTGGDRGTKTEDAVRASLKWLAHHQGPDGGWGADTFVNQCVGGRCGGAGDASYDAGVTGLSVLAFLGAGYVPMSKDEYPDPIDPNRTLKFGEVVKRGLQWLIAHQDPEGCVGERGTKYMYNHSIAALALSEAFGMTASLAVKDPAQKAIDFLVASQNPGKAWRYSAKSGDNDTSVTGWAVMALKSAELSELTFPKSAYEGALNWFTEATEPNGYYQVGYNARSTGKVYVPGKNEQFDHHASMSAVAVMSRIFLQKTKREPALTAVTLLTADLPEWKQNKIDFYYWYYASLALFQYDGPEGPVWTKWNEPMKNAIVPHQKGRSDGCKLGSWDPEPDRWGFEGGRVYAAAINCLTLEVYYRYPNVFGAGGAKK
jgi:hypothetical protein